MDNKLQLVQVIAITWYSGDQDIWYNMIVFFFFSSVIDCHSPIPHWCSLFFSWRLTKFWFGYKIICHCCCIFSDPAVDFRSLDIPVNAVATALKGFFGDLAEPLIPTHYHNELLDTCGEWFNSLWPSDEIWRHILGSTLAQVMACCLTAPSHWLNQRWLLPSLRSSPKC